MPHFLNTPARKLTNYVNILGLPVSPIGSEGENVDLVKHHKPEEQHVFLPHIDVVEGILQVNHGSKAIPYQAILYFI